MRMLLHRQYVRFLIYAYLRMNYRNKLWNRKKRSTVDLHADLHSNNFQDQSIASLVLRPIQGRRPRNQVTKTNRSVWTRFGEMDLACIRNTLRGSLFWVRPRLWKSRKPFIATRYWWIWMSISAESINCYINFAAHTALSYLPLLNVHVTDVGLFFPYRKDNRAAYLVGSDGLGWYLTLSYIPYKAE